MARIFWVLACDANTTGGDRVTVQVVKNGASIYGPTVLTQACPTAATLLANYDTPVAVNDTFRFIVSPRSNNSYDSTYLVARIAVWPSAMGILSLSPITYPAVEP
jgi:hypothetical protein